VAIVADDPNSAFGLFLDANGVARGAQPDSMGEHLGVDQARLDLRASAKGTFASSGWFCQETSPGERGRTIAALG
jgi:hypothetical protein